MSSLIELSLLSLSLLFNIPSMIRYGLNPTPLHLLDFVISCTASKLAVGLRLKLSSKQFT